jgi:hypothetical protein
MHLFGVFKGAMKANFRHMVGLLFGLFLIGIAWWMAHRPSGEIKPPAPPAAAISTPKVTRAQIDHYFNAQISPLIDAANRKDHEAVESAIQQIHSSFDGFRAGVPNFADDLTSWGTRGGIVQRIAQDQWIKWWGDPADANSVKDYVQDKFKEHVLSEQKLQDTLSLSLAQLRSDLQASHNQLAADIKASVASPECPVQIDVPDWNSWFANIERQGTELSKSKATDSIIQAALDLVGSGVAGWAGEKVVEETIIPKVVQPVVDAVLEQIATSSLVTASADGSATAVGAVGGGGVGSAGGPAGTVIGVGVGLAVGAIVDWWMTDSFKGKINGDCTKFLNDVEGQLVTGTSSNPGLKIQLLDAVDQQDAALSAKLLDELHQKGL